MEDFRQSFITYPERLVKAAHKVAQEAAQEGADRMQEIISEAGTGYAGRMPGTPRAVTEAMFDSVDVLQKSKKGQMDGSRVYTFGYVRGKIEDYFYYQDRGFNNPQKTETSADGEGPGHTRGTAALAEGKMVAREYLRANLPKEMRKK